MARVLVLSAFTFRPQQFVLQAPKSTCCCGGSLAAMKDQILLCYRCCGQDVHLATTHYV